MEQPAEEEITRVIAGYDRAIFYSDYADTIIFEPELIEGTRYKYILTTQEIELD